MLQVGFDGFVLLVELSEIGDNVFHDVGVGERVDLGLLLGVGWDAAYRTGISLCSIATPPYPQHEKFGKTYTSKPKY